MENNPNPNPPNIVDGWRDYCRQAMTKELTAGTVTAIRKVLSERRYEDVTGDAVSDGYLAAYIAASVANVVADNQVRIRLPGVVPATNPPIINFHCSTDCPNRPTQERRP